MITMNKADKAKLVDEMGTEIGFVIHTAVRKYIDSPESGVLWKAINALPDDEWKIVADAAAEHIIAVYKLGKYIKAGTA